MPKKLPFFVVAVFSIIIGLYPLAYFVSNYKSGLLSTKSLVLLQDGLWNIGFYSHISLGGLALFIGWTQFSKKLRRKNIRLHRNIGKVYIISVLLSGISSLYIAYFATGGWIASLGFSCLGIFWIISTLIAFLEIKNHHIRTHQKFMIYSYAACFAAVTLRIWLPLLTAITNDFMVSYKIVSWLCWVPNLAVANLIVKKRKL
ncbi:DUF2306 domain-containing protein [Psychroserpens sp. XS_ASV72]|uniref:DUF2306 domain-containing protein n=1 Tax=Psychroserpens sp. XS_ASV72 TaxID=3241293 RepID=UPI00351787A3